GFLVSSWSIAHIEHPGFYEGAPDWWFAEVAALVTDPLLLDVWRTATGDEPEFVNAALYVDTLLPHAVDPVMRQTCGPDGAGSWHRDRTGPKADEVERDDLLRDEPLREGGWRLALAL